MRSVFVLCFAILCGCGVVARSLWKPGLLLSQERLPIERLKSNVVWRMADGVRIENTGAFHGYQRYFQMRFVFQTSRNKFDSRWHRGIARLLAAKGSDKKGERVFRHLLAPRGAMNGAVRSCQNFGPVLALPLTR